MCAPLLDPPPLHPTALTRVPRFRRNYYNLKSLIKAIRATKTIADERALIVKESAAIRTSFKEEGQ